MMRHSKRRILRFAGMPGSAPGLGRTGAQTWTKLTGLTMPCPKDGASGIRLRAEVGQAGKPRGSMREEGLMVGRSTNWDARQTPDTASGAILPGQLRRTPDAIRCGDVPNSRFREDRTCLGGMDGDFLPHFRQLSGNASSNLILGTKISRNLRTVAVLFLRQSNLFDIP